MQGLSGAAPAPVGVIGFGDQSWSGAPLPGANAAGIVATAAIVAVVGS